MGAYNIAPYSDYLQVIAPILKAKQQLADWEGEQPVSPVALKMKDLADSIDASLQSLGLPTPIERNRFAQFSLFGYLAQFLQVPYAQRFKDCSEEQLDHLLQAFVLKNCVPNEPLIQVLKKHME